MKSQSGSSQKKQRIEESEVESLEDNSSIEFKVEPFENYEQSDVENVEEMKDMGIINNSEMHMLDIDEQQAGTSQDFHDPSTGMCLRNDLINFID